MSRSTIRTAARVGSVLALLAAVALVACMHHAASSDVDAANPGAQPDLTGSIACGSGSCGDGELCVDRSRDGSNGSSTQIETFGCVTAPTGCSLAPCSYACAIRPDLANCCPACVSALCDPFIPGLSGRDLHCQGY